MISRKPLVFEQLSPQERRGAAAMMTPLSEGVYRAHVPCGWMVLMKGEQNTLIFYPDPTHEWDGGSLDRSDDVADANGTDGAVLPGRDEALRSLCDRLSGIRRQLGPIVSALRREHDDTGTLKGYSSSLGGLADQIEQIRTALVEIAQGEDVH
jgi:hypothetical protein